MLIGDNGGKKALFESGWLLLLRDGLPHTLTQHAPVSQLPGYARSYLNILNATVMKTLFIAASAWICFSFLSSEKPSVYICVSPKAKKYHSNKNCSGLRNCTHTIKSVTVNEAKKRGLTACKLE
jgi:hypothetical protein